MAKATGSAQTCQTCKFWKPDDENDADNSAGICRAHPPTVNAGTWDCYIFLWKSTSSEWPEADAFDWCGEYAPNGKLCESAGRKKTFKSDGDVAAPSDSQQKMAMPPSVGNAHNNTKDK